MKDGNTNVLLYSTTHRQKTFSEKYSVILPHPDSYIVFPTLSFPLSLSFVVHEVTDVCDHV